MEQLKEKDKQWLLHNTDTTEDMFPFFETDGNGRYVFAPREYMKYQWNQIVDNFMNEIDKCVILSIIMAVILFIAIIGFSVVVSNV